jgi:hypothetical protein
MKDRLQPSHHFVQAKPKKPHEIPRPGTKPETVPSKEPDPTVWPHKEPEIQPGKEPLTIPPPAPTEIPQVFSRLDSRACSASFINAGIFFPQ